MISRSSLLVVSALAGCVSTDLEDPDASVITFDMRATPDRGAADRGFMPPPPPPTCEGAPFCFSNYACAEDEACVFDDFGQCCQRAERGSLPLGAPCLNGPSECISGLCFGTDEGAFCTEACASDLDCHPALPGCTSVQIEDAIETWCDAPRLE